MITDSKFAEENLKRDLLTISIFDSIAAKTKTQPWLHNDNRINLPHNESLVGMYLFL